LQEKTKYKQASSQGRIQRRGWGNEGWVGKGVRDAEGVEGSGEWGRADQGLR